MNIPQRRAMDRPDFVAKLALAIFNELEAGYWGAIEPETFYNVAHGYTHAGDVNMLYNKISAVDAADSAREMKKILARALLRAMTKEA